MSWHVLIDYGSGWVDLSSFGGQDLTRDSLQLTEKLHDKDFKPALGSVSFTASSTSTLASNLISCTDDIPCEIFEDGTLFFRGFARPVTKFLVSEDQTVDFEIFDYGYALEKALQNDFIISNGKVCDPADVENSVIHRLLDEAGYPSAYIETLATISTVIPRLTLKAGTKYSDAIADVLWDYHHLYTVSGNGAFTVYDWAPATISTTGTITESEIIDRLEVERKDKEEDQVQVVYNRYLLLPGKTLYYKKEDKHGTIKSDDGEHAFNRIWPTDEPARLSYSMPPESDGQLEIIATENQAVHTVGYYSKLKSVLWGFIDWYEDEKVTGLPIPYVSHSTTYTDIQIDTRPSRWLNSIKITGDMHVVYKGDNKTSIYSIPGATGRLKEYSSEYLYDGEAAKALAQAILSTIENGGLFYSFKSETEYALGGYYTLTSFSLNSSGPMRITSRKWDKVTEIWEYEAVSVGAMSVVAGTLVEGGFFIPTNPDEIASIIERVSAGLETDGTLMQPITGNALASFSPDTPGLYMTADKLGYFDGTVWRSVINDDGTFKFETAGGDYIEWDGTGTLKIMGDLFLSGNSELRGKVTTGNGITSDVYVAGVSGWNISGDGDAEFNDVTVRGTVEADAGEIGGFKILETLIRDVDNRLVLNSAEKRFEVKDHAGVVKAAVGYLDGLGGYTASDYGLWVGAPKTVHIEGDADYSAGDWTINSDGAYVIKDSGDVERGRFGSLGAGGPVGLKIGDIDPDAGTGEGIYVDETGKAVFSGDLTVGTMPYPSDVGLKAYWSFDDGQGEIVTDNSGNGNNGLIFGGPLWVNGISGKAIQYDGESYTYVDLEGILYAAGAPWTLTFHFNATGILFKNGNVKIERISNTQLFVTIRGLVNDVEVPSLSGSHQCTIIFDGTNCTLLIDAKPAEEYFQGPLLDSDGVLIADTDGILIDGNYDYWRIT